MIPLTAHEVPTPPSAKALTLSFELEDGSTVYLRVTTVKSRNLRRGRTTLIERPSRWHELLETLAIMANRKPPLS